MGIEHRVPRVSLREEDLLAEAHKRAGSCEWGTYDFRDALRVLLQCIRNEARLSHTGQFLNWRNITRVLTNRLLIEQEKQKRGVPYPESCEQPVFIAGLPRTGTTLLHNLLIQDPDSHYLRLCDGMYPSPPPHPEKRQHDERVEKAGQYTTTMYSLRPELKKVHYIEATSPEECLWLFEHQFLDPVFAVRMHIPSYNEWLFQRNHDASYADYHEMLNSLALHFPSRRWVLKAPRHIFFINSLLKEFPKACIIWTHRDPAKVIPSMASMSYLYRQWFSKKTDPIGTGQYQLLSFSKGIQWAMSLRKQADASRFYDLQYQDLMNDPGREVEKIYEYFNIPFSDNMKKSILVWIQNNPQNKHGRHSYSPEEFGLTSAQIRQEYASYSERFHIPQESD